MEFISCNKKGSEPIHARKVKLTPINLKQKRPPESKTKIECSPKNYDLPRINTLDCNELTQYMSCGGIKLSIRLNLSVEKRRKKKIDLHHAGSLVTTQKGGAFTAPTTTFQLGALGAIHNRKILNIRPSKMIQNPQELKYMFRIAQVPEESLILTKHTSKQLYAFYIPQKTYVILHPSQESLHYPPPHHYLINPIGITEFASLQTKFYIFKSYNYQSISKLINEFGTINPRLVRVYTRQLVEAVWHLHLNGFRHNRLNLNCMMHNGEGKILVNWLRAAKGPISQKEKHKYYYYFPPEALLSRNYNDSQKNDVWAIGCIALQLLSSGSLERSFLHPYNRSTAGYMSESTDILNKVKSLMEMLGLSFCEQVDTIEHNMSVLAVQFVSMCLTVCIERRASITELLSHPFLSK